MSASVEPRHDPSRTGVTHGSPEASAVIWDWRGPSDPAGPADLARRHRRAALIQTAVAWSIAGLLFGWRRDPTLPLVIVGISSTLLVLALISPNRAYAAVQRGIRHLTALVLRLLTWVMLVPVFYLFFLPFGLLFRRGGRDPMERSLEPDAATYWKARSERAATDYEKQF